MQRHLWRYIQTSFMKAGRAGSSPKLLFISCETTCKRSAWPLSRQEIQNWKFIQIMYSCGYRHALYTTTTLCQNTFKPTIGLWWDGMRQQNLFPNCSFGKHTYYKMRLRTKWRWVGGVLNKKIQALRRKPTRNENLRYIYTF